MDSAAGYSEYANTTNMPASWRRDTCTGVCAEAGDSVVVCMNELCVQASPQEELTLQSE